MKHMLHMEAFDEVDLKIINVLKKDCKLSERDISAIVKASPATVHRRIKKLEESGIIKGYGAKIDEAKVRGETVTYVLINTSPKANFNDLMTEIFKRDEVEEIAALSGTSDILLKVRTHTTQELSDVVLKFLRNFESIDKTQSMITFNHLSK